MGNIAVCACCNEIIGNQDFLRIDRGVIHANCATRYGCQVSSTIKPGMFIEGDSAMNFINRKGIEISTISSMRPLIC